MRIRRFFTVILPAALLVAVFWLMDVSGIERLIDWLRSDD